MPVQERKTVQEIFGVKNGVGSTSNSTFTVPDFSSRDFPGSTTKKKKNKKWPPFGPAMEFNSEFSDMSSTRGTSGADFGGDAGGGMGESVKDEKFNAFIESITTEENSNTISTIMEGYKAIYEK